MIKWRKFSQMSMGTATYPEHYDTMIFSQLYQSKTVLSCRTEPTTTNPISKFPFLFRRLFVVSSIRMLYIILSTILRNFSDPLYQRYPVVLYLDHWCILWVRMIIDPIFIFLPIRDAQAFGHIVFIHSNINSIF